MIVSIELADNAEGTYSMVLRWFDDDSEMKLLNC